MALRPSATRYAEVQIPQKGHTWPNSLAFRPRSEATEMYETEFEDDLSDGEDYSGRRSEDSFGKRSDTTLSSFEELRTPNSNNFDGFQFDIHSKPPLPRPVEGPSGPHLFRMSQEPTENVDFYLSMSPPMSPDEAKAGPPFLEHYYCGPKIDEAVPNSLALGLWTPRDVANWMHKLSFESSIIDQFRNNDISGAILMDLKFEDLKELGVSSFGHRHRLWNEIRTLRGSGLTSVPTTPADEQRHSPVSGRDLPFLEQRATDCPNPASPESDQATPTVGRRFARRARMSRDDIISPAESASIVAIEQLLPKPHVCSKGESCLKWQKQQRKLAKIAKEFPLELEQISESNAAHLATAPRPTSEAVPSVVASSDVLGPGQRPALRLEENYLRVLQTRDPQENVRQFLNFQHMDHPVEEPTASPLELFPPLSPPGWTPAPHDNLKNLPKLTIPSASIASAASPNRTAIPGSAFRRGTPITAVEIKDRSTPFDIYRFGSPASEMDVPTTAIPNGPIARDDSQSVPPDMRFGGEQILRSSSRQEYRRQPTFMAANMQSAASIGRSTSLRKDNHHHHQPSFAMAPLKEQPVLAPASDQAATIPTTVGEVNHTGWMKKRKTKMLRHEWQENHFRLNGTCLAMHKDEKATPALECIDVDEYAVACSSLASNKLGAAFKSLKLSSKKKEALDTTAFSFQLVPAAEKKGMLHAATGKTHHFAVKNRDERIDWMRELMLAKALKQKGEGYEINMNGNIV